MFIELLSYARIFAVATECSRILVLVLFIMIAYSFGHPKCKFLGRTYVFYKRDNNKNNSNNNAFFNPKCWPKDMCL